MQRRQPGSLFTDHGLLHARRRPGTRALLIGLTLSLAACGQPASPAALPDPLAAGTGLLDSGSPDTVLSAQRLRSTEFGPNVRVFDPSMKVADIQAAVDAVYAQQVSNQFGSQRNTFLFRPGSYGTATQPLMIKVGYYTEVAGLGASPTDVTINGHVDVFNQCLDGGGTSNCVALVNFWRTASNLSVNLTNPAGYDGCRGSGNFWAVSQAAPLRRFNMMGGTLTLMDYCTAGPQFASGGFIADSQAGTIVNGSQQQFLTRNSQIGAKIGSWSNGVWNQVFAGVTNAPAQSFGVPGGQPYTTLARNPVSREKPYLYLDAAGRYRVFVPDVQNDSAGVTWTAGQGAGRSLSVGEFYVARPGDSVQSINNALSRGLNLIFTPGVYDVARTIRVKRANTVVLGLGLATLTAQNGAVAMTVADVPGVEISGLMFDAGAVNSPVLLQVGRPRGHQGYHDAEDGEASDRHSGSASNPTTLNDVYFRVGGPHNGKATVSLEVNSDSTILDNLWAWRADHGDTPTGWSINTADTGVVVNGDNVTATGLFVEHYQKNEVVWNGENGRTIMFQNEMPYDVPNQAAWTQGTVEGNTVLGYAAYKVADTVRTHEGWGMGSYIFTNVDPKVHATHGFEVPVTPGVRLHDLLSVQLGAGTIDHVINQTGAPVTSAAVGVPSTVVSFP